MNESMTEEVRKLVEVWGHENIRDFPWRYSSPYRVLVSEFMLHRTQALQVVPVYSDFVNKYPDLKEFSGCNIDDARELLSPLGLGWRIDGMIDALHQIWDLYGDVPSDYDSLIAIRGIGQYIAGAVIVFGNNIPMSLIDTNTVRVIGRLYGLDLSGEARRRKDVKEAISLSVDPVNPRNFYYALIDIAHLICRVKKPSCSECPLFHLPCIFGKKNQIEPVD